MFLHSTVPGSSLHGIDRPESEGVPFYAKHAQGVYIVTVDDFVKEQGVEFPNHIKIDVGGAEKGIVKNMKGVLSDHRLQTIRKLNGVTYINDSKATNIQSVIVATKSFDDPIILILGGKNKNSDFRLLLPHTKRHVKHIVSYGEAGGEIAAAIGDAVRLNCVSSLSEAVASAHNLASPGDIVLMSPGCASFDQFNNFEERGEKFISLVNNLIEKI